MQISGFSQIHQAHSAQPSQRFDTSAASRPDSQVYGPDEVEFSQEAQAASEATESADIRANRIADIRAQIQAGTYETPEKLELALERMLGDLG